MTILLGSQRRGDIAGYLVGLLVSALVGLMVVFTALNTQSERVLDVNGVNWSFGLLFGPRAFTGQSRQGWEQISRGPAWSPDGQRFDALLALHLHADALYIAAYTILFALIMIAVCRSWWWLCAGLPLVVLVAADVVEDRLARTVTGGQGSINALVYATETKWLALLIMVLVLVLRIATQRPTHPAMINRTTVSRAWRAIQHQRFSVLPSLIIFVLSVLAGAAILEQLPDVERSWANAAELDPQAMWAIAAVLILTTSVYLSTRIRIGYAQDRLAEQDAVAAGEAAEEGSAAPKALLRVWLVPVAVVLLAAGGWAAGWLYQRISGVELGLGQLVWPRSLAFVGVPVLIIGISVLIRCLWSAALSPYRPPLMDAANLAAVRFVGNAATAAVVVVAGLGLIRAFVPIWLLRDQFGAQSATRPLIVDLGQTRGWLLTGFGGIVLPWLITIAARVAQRSLPKLTTLSSFKVGRALFIGWFAIFAALGLFPQLASELGLAATAVLAIGALTGLVSAMGLLMQGQKPAEVFLALGFRRTPLVTVFAGTLVLVGALSGTGTIHQMNRGAASPHADVRPSLADTFGSWVGAQDGCNVPFGARQVRPMLMIAAEGGGIRAAYWTVRGLEELGRDTCASKSVLFSTGASGGSVGLTIARFSGNRADPGGVRAVEAVQQMAEESTLSAAADGTFVRDTFYGATGVPFAQPLAASRPWAWVDRAGLIEAGWTDSYDRDGPPWGSRSYLSDPDPSPATGALILNSTSVEGTCRVWLSQVSFSETAARPAPRSDPENNCDKVPGPAARTIDLFSTYGPYTGGGAPSAPIPGCLGDIPAATAALLTARFPYVTPGGGHRALPGSGEEGAGVRPVLAADPAGRRRLSREQRLGDHHRSGPELGGPGPGPQSAGDG